MRAEMIRSVALFLSLLYLSLYLPLVYPIYFSGWYKVNCQWHPRCERVGPGVADQGIRELNGFFRHEGALLSPFWSTKEKMHLKEVRGITDTLFWGGLAASLVLALCFRRETLYRCAVINIAVALSLVSILPFFSFFWRHIFHAVLFDNNLWLNTPRDLSYYIMPRQFFKYTTAYLIASVFLINLAVASPLLFRRFARGPQVGTG